MREKREPWVSLKSTVRNKTYRKKTEAQLYATRDKIEKTYGCDAASLFCRVIKDLVLKGEEADAAAIFMLSSIFIDTVDEALYKHFADNNGEVEFIIDAVECLNKCVDEFEAERSIEYDELY